MGVGALVKALHGVVSQLVEVRARTRPQTVQVCWAGAKILHGPGTCQINVQSHAENALLAALRLVASQLVEAHAKTRLQTVQAYLRASAQNRHGLSTCQRIVQGIVENAGEYWLLHCLDPLSPQPS